MTLTLRSRRPHACGEVLCTEPGRSHLCLVGMPGRFTGGINLTLDMNADEKSDKVIVPEKPSNNGGLPLAESVEERTLPKRNTSQTTVVRTQRRVATSSGLAGVRQAARQGKDVRFIHQSEYYIHSLDTASTLVLEGGAQCVSSARWDLRGGCRVTGIPTATAYKQLPGCRNRPVSDARLL